MRVARFFFAGTAGLPHDERHGAGGERVESELRGGEIGEIMQPATAVANFSGGLLTAEEEHSECGQFGACEAERVRRLVAGFGHAIFAAAQHEREVLVAEPVEGAANLGFGVGDDGVAVAELVAGVGERVHFAHVSRRVIVRLKTGLAES